MKGLLILALVTAAPLAAQQARADEPAAPATGTAPAAAPAAAPAEGASGFGGAHTVVISSDAQLAFSYQTATTVPIGTGAGASITEGGNSVTTIELVPALDYFVIDNLSIGGEAILVWENISGSGANSSSTSITALGIGPRVGYYIPFTDRVGIWPRLGVTFATASASNGGGSVTEFALNANAPFLFHVAPHFFLGFGPTFATDLVSSASNAAGQSQDQPKVTRFGVQLTVGGWF